VIVPHEDLGFSGDEDSGMNKFLQSLQYQRMGVKASGMRTEGVYEGCDDLPPDLSVD